MLTKPQFLPLTVILMVVLIHPSSKTISEGTIFAVVLMSISWALLIGLFIMSLRSMKTKKD